MFLFRLTQPSEILPAALVLFHPFACERSTLDIGKDLFHGSACLVADNLWPARQVTILSRIRNRIAHPGESTFVDEIDDQLHFVDALEVCDLRLISGFDQSFKA